MPDEPITALLPDIERLLEIGAIVYLKWTCPKCGDRVLADEPNCYKAGGYTHTERDDGSPCGGIYTGDQFGMAVAIPTTLTGPQLLQLLQRFPDLRERMTVLVQQ